MRRMKRPSGDPWDPKAIKEFLDRFTVWQGDATYPFFRAMSTKAAKAFLTRFLEAGPKLVEQVRQGAKKAGLVMDYSLNMLPAVLKWMSRSARVIAVPFPEDWTEEMRSDYEDGLCEFDENSKPILLRSAYHLGESFARANPSLRWATGAREKGNLSANMPVVVGFTDDWVLEPLLQIENLFLGILHHGDPDATIDDFVRDYIDRIPGVSGMSGESRSARLTRLLAEAEKAWDAGDKERFYALTKEMGIRNDRQ